ncbi:MAG: OmpA family protein [Ignavibacteriae bacterium]|nr:OmpA family protein [Ignavibacteriota bacterium]
MKLNYQIITLLLIFTFAIKTQAQFNVLEKVKKKVEKKIDKNVNESIDKTLDNTEKEIKEGSTNNNEKSDAGNESVKEEKITLNTETTSNTKNENDKKLKLWSKYDFVSGDNIIFEDNLFNEENGEFPSRWDLISGNAENAEYGNDKVINFAQPSTTITPIMDKDEYLPEVFTLEFDAFFHDKASTRQQRYLIKFWTQPRTRERDKDSRLIDPIIIDWNSANMYKYNGKIEEETSEVRSNWKGQWKHIALAFNKRSLKLYLNESRLLNIPNSDYKPKMFSIEAFYDKKNIDVTAIKNIRLAEGGKKLYNRVISEGKFLTRGILFDVNKSLIKPESMGIINAIVEMMNEHQYLNFSIEGHTDSDGDDFSNQKLSEERAEAVKKAIIELNISEDRLKSKGFGESVPVDNNSTPEGKANNRRVEFIKF